MYQIRLATKDDIDDIITLVKELASYEKMSDKVTFSNEQFSTSIFKNNYAKILVCEYKNDIIGYAIYFYTFSSFLGRGGIYLEDLYVKSEFRNQGIGKKFLATLAQICIDENLGRLEWECLTWNEPSLAFYYKLGAKNRDEFFHLRVDGKELENLANLLKIK
ncbi:MULTISPECIES: GNAT family N-acetyltransferase [Campylobacter]|uniref:GNAT family N-acetyltransferase n=1 Tax=Campylobacter vicugnae TaxID=1660076 RepID=A0ABZ2E953_9BACT|nr:MULTISPECIES: GNAT family N-acetyltransferase [unclassified Campylobacter]ARR03687.1 putative acetyltransferase (GNAT family) [Campylobacter sp. RM12175]MCR8689410.1 GNAT family N-acetyltransferase [Campylobacter sp. RM9264]MCR8701133.1 GNAT family N-acetyltransferase [Campylobacter sp. RM12176]